MLARFNLIVDIKRFLVFRGLLNIFVHVIALKQMQFLRDIVNEL